MEKFKTQRGISGKINIQKGFEYVFYFKGLLLVTDYTSHMVTSKHSKNDDKTPNLCCTYIHHFCFKMKISIHLYTFLECISVICFICWLLEELCAPQVHKCFWLLYFLKNVYTFEYISILRFIFVSTWRRSVMNYHINIFILNKIIWFVHMY